MPAPPPRSVLPVAVAHQRQGADAGADTPWQGFACAHGLLLGNAATFYFTLAPALARRAPTWTYDLRGHGNSPRPAGPYTLAAHAADLLALLDICGPPSARWGLVGHSYGALIALRAALDAPHRVAALVLVEPPRPPSETLGDALATLRASPESMVDVLPASVRAALLRGGRRARRLMETLHGLATETSLLADLDAEPDFDDDALAELRIPTLVVTGRASRCHAAGLTLSTVLPDASHIALDAGHWVPTEAATELTDAVVRWLADRDHGAHGVRAEPRAPLPEPSR